MIAPITIFINIWAAMVCGFRIACICSVWGGISVIASFRCAENEKLSWSCCGIFNKNEIGKTYLSKWMWIVTHAVIPRFIVWISVSPPRMQHTHYPAFYAKAKNFTCLIYLLIYKVGGWGIEHFFAYFLHSWGWKINNYLLQLYSLHVTPRCSASMNFHLPHISTL